MNPVAADQHTGLGFGPISEVCSYPPIELFNKDQTTVEGRLDTSARYTGSIPR